MPNELIIIVTLFAFGYFFGTWAEKKHYASIMEREKAFIHLPAVTAKTVNIDESDIEMATMVYGSAVISIDYFKQVLALFRNLIGGSIASYETLMDRARREAMLRMKEMASDAAIIVNVRLETSTIGKNTNQKNNVGCVEVLAYGTALKLKR